MNDLNRLLGAKVKAKYIDEGHISEIHLLKDGSPCFMVNHGTRENPGNCSSGFSLKDLEIIEENKNNMNLTPMLRRALDKDMQALYKAGYLNGDLKLTQKGIDVLNVIMFDTYKEKLVVEAKEDIAQESAATAKEI